MGTIKGLIIPRSYNDYISRSDPLAFRNALNGTGLIPADASAQNQLADKDFVNSSIGTNTANYISDDGEPFTSVADLEAYSGTVTNNDYAFVTGTDSDGNTYYDRYKATVSAGVVSWAKEYRLNNSSFTQAQWDALNSGITEELVAQIGQGGGGSALVPDITQAEYDALTPEEQNNGQIRHITDAPETPVPFAVVNDTITTSANVWTAQETQRRINTATEDLEKNIYNFDEEVIIGYVIQNGVKKSLYRKCFHQNFINNQEILTGVEELYNSSGWWKSEATGFKFPHPFANNAAVYATVRLNNNAIYADKNLGTTDVMLVLEYTKTTD